MKVRFHEAGVKRLGQKRVEVAAGQVVEVEWADMARFSPAAYEIVAEAAPEPVREPTPEKNPESDPEPPVASTGKRGR